MCSELALGGDMPKSRWAIVVHWAGDDVNHHMSDCGY
jgi:hypothetical protein